MRYYNIQLQGTSTTPGATPPVKTLWTSFPNGILDPNAQQVEFDFFSFNQSDNYQGLSTVSIYGDSLDTLNQANGGSYTGMTLTMKAGMQAGLPLANPAQANTILQGKVYQSFGNWVGTDMTLDFVLNYAHYSYNQPGNFVLNWPRKTSLKAALTTCFNVAYPNLGAPLHDSPTGILMLIGDGYILQHDVYHAVNTLHDLSQMITSLTRSIKSPGVTITFQSSQNQIIVSDGTVALGKPIPIAFTDLVGQPTWIDQNVMQFTTVMRADVQVGSIVSMPTGLPESAGTVILTKDSLPSSLKYQTSFQGNFTITGVRYIGNFRDPSGLSWVSIFRCVPKTPGVPVIATG